jgi:hypothetical protein
MVSDLLSQAVSDIAKCLKDHPQAYGDAELWIIQGAVANMEHARRYLDFPPDCEVLRRVAVAKIAETQQ